MCRGGGSIAFQEWSGHENCLRAGRVEILGGGPKLTRLCTSERCYSLQRVEYILYALPNITAATIVPAIQDTLAQLNLALNKGRGQYYNGASTMRGLNYMLL